MCCWSVTSLSEFSRNVGGGGGGGVGGGFDRPKVHTSTPFLQQVGNESANPKGSSVFYCNVNESSRALSPVESLETEEDESSSSSSSVPCANPLARVSPQASCPSDTKNADTEAERQGAIERNETAERIQAANVSNLANTSTIPARPLELSLHENDRKPRLKRIVMGIQSKREGRLLSVPNLKYQKTDGSTVCDLRCEDNTAPVADSFTGNLIRRFSKCFNLNK